MGAPLVAFAAGVPLPAAAAGLLILTASGFGYQLPLQRRFLATLPRELRGQGEGLGLLSAEMMGGQGLGPIAVGALAALSSPARRSRAPASAAS